MLELRPFTKCVRLLKRASTRRRERGAGKNAQTMLRFAALHAGVESPFAWLRLVAAVVLSTIGSVGMWSVPVVLPAVQAEFAVARADASLPFTLAMIGFACGGVAMGRLTDRFGIGAPVICGALALAVGYVAAGFSHSLMVFALVHTLIRLGASATFGPLIADSLQWFTRRRGIAVAIVSSGNYFCGTIWPPVVQHFVATEGWRATHIGIGAFCPLTILPFLLALRRRPPIVGGDLGGALCPATPARRRPFPLTRAAAGGFGAVLPL